MKTQISALILFSATLAVAQSIAFVGPEIGGQGTFVEFKPFFTGTCSGYRGSLELAQDWKMLLDVLDHSPTARFETVPFSDIQEIRFYDLTSAERATLKDRQNNGDKQVDIQDSGLHKSSNIRKARLTRTSGKIEDGVWLHFVKSAYYGVPKCFGPELQGWWITTESLVVTKASKKKQ